MSQDQMREAFERMYKNDPEKLARGKYLRQDYDRLQTQQSWEVFQAAWPIIFAAGMDRAAGICEERKTENWGLTEAEHEAVECADAIRAELKGDRNA